MTEVKIVAVLIVFLSLMAGLYYMHRRKLSFSIRVFTGLAAGIVFGLALLGVFGPGSGVVQAALDWTNIVGTGYVRLLQMVVVPLVFISIITAFTKMELRRDVVKVGGLILAILIGTTAVAALLGMGAAAAFDLKAIEVEQGEQETGQAARLEGLFETTLEDATLPRHILELFPANPFLDLTGARRTSTIAVVIFAAFIGMAYLGLTKRDPETAETFEKMTAAVHAVIMQIVTFVIRLTPYGVMAIMTRVAATSDYASIGQLGKFVVASYTALIIMFAVHLLLLLLGGLNPATYVKKIAPVLAFAFSSRSSAATLPLNVEAQTGRLGVPGGIANFAGSVGLSVGQNGCAGIYPAMLAAIIAPTVGINPFTPGFLITVIAVTAIASFGVAGVGGGATFAALLVLSILGLPVGLAGLLISVEPLIDMGRTAVNVSGSMTAGLLTARITGGLAVDTYNAALTEGSA